MQVSSNEDESSSSAGEDANLADLVDDTDQSLFSSQPKKDL